MNIAGKNNFLIQIFLKYFKYFHNQHLKTENKNFTMLAKLTLSRFKTDCYEIKSNNGIIIRFDFIAVRLEPSKSNHAVQLKTKIM